MSKSKGFTLIELLAVIAILAIVLLIAVPTVLNMIEKARTGAFRDNSLGILRASKDYVGYFNIGEEGYNLVFDEDGQAILDISKLDLETSDLKGYLLITKEGSNYTYKVNVWDGTYRICSSSNVDLEEVEKTSETCDDNTIVITINGDNPYILNLGEPYIEYGAIAKDGNNNELEIKIQSNNVDINTPGIYNVIYRVKNVVNSPTATREVIVNYVTLLSKIEQQFGKSAGGCVPATVTTSSFTDTACAYEGVSPNNYVSFGGTTWRILGFKKDVDGTIGIRILAPAGMVTGTHTFGDNGNTSSYNCYFDGTVGVTSPSPYGTTCNGATSIKNKLNDTNVTCVTGGSNWCYGKLDSVSQNMLVPMKYDITLPKNDSHDLSGVSISKWTNTSYYVGLPSWREVQACAGLGYSGSSSTANNTNCWAIADSTADYYWLTTPYWASPAEYPSHKPAASVSLHSGISVSSFSPTTPATVRPVVNLKPAVKVTGGDGTSSNPWQLTL